MRRTLIGQEHDAFASAVDTFFEREVAPHYPAWEDRGYIDRDLYRVAGRQGLLGYAVPTEHGGLGLADPRLSVLITESSQRWHAGAVGSLLSLQNDVCLPYFLSLAGSEQRDRWLPGITSGDTVCAIGMTEPGAGSDLMAIRTSARHVDGGYLLNGAKTFITSGAHADLTIVAARMDGGVDGSLTLFVVERGTEGFHVGEPLRKPGQRAQDTTELHFEETFVPSSNVLGEVGAGRAHLRDNLASERLSIAVAAIAAARKAVDITLDYARDREVFGRRLWDLQNTQFVLAECAVEVEATQVYVDRCVEAYAQQDLSGREAAAVKLRATEVQARTIDRCLQLFSGYGFMWEQPLTRMYADARVTTIYGGTSEIMKTIVARDLERRSLGPVGTARARS